MRSGQKHGNSNLKDKNGNDCNTAGVLLGRGKHLKKWFGVFVIGTHLHICGLEFNILCSQELISREITRVGKSLKANTYCSNPHY